MSQTRVLFATAAGARFVLEGSADFVEAHLGEFLELAQKKKGTDATETAEADGEGNPASEGTAANGSKQSLRGFLDQKGPRNVYEAIASALYYSGKFENRPELGPPEIRDLLVQGKYRPPGSISQALVDCRRKYGFVEVGSKKGLWKLSHQGETMVEFDLPRD